MENTIATAISLRTRADYKAAIEQCLAEVQRLHEQMAHDQEDLDHLRAETKACLAALYAQVVALQLEPHIVEEEASNTRYQG